jgi:hypothetical protein
MAEKTYKDTDVREALRRKYSDTPKLPADFMKKMVQPSEPDEAPKLAPVIRRWRWVAAVACLLIMIGIGVNYQSKTYHETVHESAVVAEAKKPETLSSTSERHIEAAPCTESATKAKPQRMATSAEKIPAATEGACISPLPDIPSKCTPVAASDLHNASLQLTVDTTYQAPGKVDEFIAKMATYHKVKAVVLNCVADTCNTAVEGKAYVFQDTQQLDLFARLLQVACCYDNKTPGYLLNFSHQQFYFTLKDLRKGEKYLWIAERIPGERILLFSTHSPIETAVSSACYQSYRDKLIRADICSFHF